VTTDDLTPGLPAIAPPRLHRAKRFLLLPLLVSCALPALAAPEPAPVVPEAIELQQQPAPSIDLPLAPPTTATAASAAPATPTSHASAAAPQPAAATGSTLRRKADAAATATLAALLPHLAGNDALPLLDRSAMFAGDISRLINAYELGQGAEGRAQQGAAASQAVTDNRVQQVLKGAMSLVGTPYRWGGTSPDTGFDCSGLVGYVFRNVLGVELPRVSREIAGIGEGELIKDRNALSPGDLVFFGMRGRINHVGIYVGEGQFLHAPSRGKDVRVDSMTGGYWGTRFMQARRIDI